MVAVTGGKPNATNVGNVISVPEPTIALIAPAPTPANAIRIMWATGTQTTLPRWNSRLRGAQQRVGSALPGAGAALLPHPHVDLDGAALEAELLPQLPLQKPPVTGLQEPRGEQHEGRRPGRRLGGEQDLGLLATPHRRWRRSDDLLEEGVQLPGRDATVPGGERSLQCGNQLLDGTTRLRRDVDPLRPLN